MSRNLFWNLGLAILFVSAGCKSPGTGASDRASDEENLPSLQDSVDSREIVRPKKLGAEDGVSTALPQRGVLVALIRWGSTTLGVFDVSSGKLTRLATRETGDLLFSRAGNRVAYLVREGPNPAKNYVEILDLRQARMSVVQPASGYAIAGFTLDPDGQRLSYAAMDLRASRSTHVTWRTGVADLERNEARVTLTSNPHDVPGEGIPVPFEWSGRTGLLYLQGLLPFRGMVTQGIWAMKPDGSGLTRLIPEPAYAGVPRLSPDGLRLSYLATELESLPRNYVPRPGAPPGNVLFVMNLASGDKSRWAGRTESAFGAYAWSAGGDGILAIGQTWLEGRFRDVEILRIGKERSLSVGKIDQSRFFREVTGILECRDGSLFWVEKGSASAKLHSRNQGNSEALFDFPEGNIQMLGCLNR